MTITIAIRMKEIKIADTTEPASEVMIFRSQDQREEAVDQVKSWITALLHTVQAYMEFWASRPWYNCR